MTNLLYIAVGGALGAVGRYTLSGWVLGLCGEKFPYGTLAVNLIGCFLVGLVVQVSQTTTLISEEMRKAIVIGFLGALTTFSTFGLETLRLLEQSQWTKALGNVAVSVIVGLAAVWVGITLARLIW